MRLTAEGKMPIMLDNYLRFEKPKEDAAAAGLATPVGAAEGVATYLELNKRNVNQWHWEETDHTEWAKARMSELFDGLEVALGDGAPKITFTGVTEFAGDAFTHIRKAKFSAGYELSFGLDWKAGTLRCLFRHIILQRVFMNFCVVFYLRLWHCQIIVALWHYVI